CPIRGQSPAETCVFPCSACLTFVRSRAEPRSCLSSRSRHLSYRRQNNPALNRRLDSQAAERRWTSLGGVRTAFQESILEHAGVAGNRLEQPQGAAPKAPSPAASSASCRQLRAGRGAPANRRASPPRSDSAGRVLSAVPS